MTFHISLIHSKQFVSISVFSMNKSTGLAENVLIEMHHCNTIFQDNSVDTALIIKAIIKKCVIGLSQHDAVERWIGSN